MKIKLYDKVKLLKAVSNEYGTFSKGQVFYVWILKNNKCVLVDRIGNNLKNIDISIIKNV